MHPNASVIQDIHFHPASAHTMTGADVRLQATRLLRLRLAFNASTIFFHALVLILCGICIAKYPEDESGDLSYGYLYMFMLGCPVCYQTRSFEGIN